MGNVRGGFGAVGMGRKFVLPGVPEEGVGLEPRETGGRTPGRAMHGLLTPSKGRGESALADSGSMGTGRSARKRVSLEGNVVPDEVMEESEEMKDPQTAEVMKLLERGAAYRRGEVDRDGRVSLEGTTDKPVLPRALLGKAEILGRLAGARKRAGGLDFKTMERVVRGGGLAGAGGEGGTGERLRDYFPQGAVRFLSNTGSGMAGMAQGSVAGSRKAQGAAADVSTQGSSVDAGNASNPGRAQLITASGKGSAAALPHQTQAKTAGESAGNGMDPQAGIKPVDLNEKRKTLDERKNIEREIAVTRSQWQRDDLEKRKLELDKKIQGMGLNPREVEHFYNKDIANEHERWNVSLDANSKQRDYTLAFLDLDDEAEGNWAYMPKYKQANAEKILRELNDPVIGKEYFEDEPMRQMMKDKMKAQMERLSPRETRLAQAIAQVRNDPNNKGKSALDVQNQVNEILVAKGLPAWRDPSPQAETERAQGRFSERNRGLVNLWTDGVRFGAQNTAAKEATNQDFENSIEEGAQAKKRFDKSRDAKESIWHTRDLDQWVYENGLDWIGNGPLGAINELNPVTRVASAINGVASSYYDSLYENRQRLAQDPGVPKREDQESLARKQAAAEALVNWLVDQGFKKATKSSDEKMKMGQSLLDTLDNPNQVMEPAKRYLTKGVTNVLKEDVKEKLTSEINNTLARGTGAAPEEAQELTREELAKKHGGAFIKGLKSEFKKEKQQGIRAIAANKEKRARSEEKKDREKAEKQKQDREKREK